jgi:hypothetical protein
MLNDLGSIHDAAISADKAVMLISGADIDALVDAGAGANLPTQHEQI